MDHQGKYELLHHLGSDSLTEDYIGHRTDSSAHKKVLIKRLLPNLVKDAALVQIFLEQAQRASHLYHPNIIQIHDFGQDGDVPFIVLEEVTGHTLQQIIDQSILLELPISMGIVSHIIIRICNGLDYAHSLTGVDTKSLEIVHGGISPKNILLSIDGDIKLIDFCTAGALNHLAETKAHLQLDQRAYMSPEQCQGQTLDMRSDVFSVGILLYEMACRRRLFRRNTIQATIQAIVTDPFPPPSAVVSDLPDSVENAIMMALKRHPQDRYKTIKLMQMDLQTAFDELGWNVGRNVVAGYLSNLFPESVSPAELEDSRQSLALSPAKSIEVIPADHDEVTQSEEIFTSADLPQQQPKATVPPQMAIQWSESREASFNSLNPLPALDTGQFPAVSEKTDVLPASLGAATFAAQKEPSGDISFSSSDPTIPPFDPRPSTDLSTTPPIVTGGTGGSPLPGFSAPPSDFPPGDSAPPASAPSLIAPQTDGGQVSSAMVHPALGATVPPSLSAPSSGSSHGAAGSPLIAAASATVKTDNPLATAPAQRRRWSLVVAIVLVLALLGAGLAWNAMKVAPPVNVEVISNPPGASVYLNGEKNFKSTPTFLGNVFSEHELSIVLIKTGYKPWIKNFPPQTKLPTRIVADLTPSLGAHASLSVKVNVMGAQVYFDGEMRGEAPVVIRSVSSGKSHLLVVKKEGYQEVSQSIQALAPLEKRSLEIHLEPQVTR